MKFDPYETLGIDRGADTEQVNAAFKRRAKEAHPDGGGSAEAFQGVKNAQRLLTDQRRRKIFDETGRVEPDTPDVIRSRALEMLSELTAMSLKGDEDPFGTDLIDAIVMTLRDKDAETQRQITPLVKMKDRARRMMGRFKRKKVGENLLDAMVAKHRRSIEQAIEPLVERRKVIARAIEIAQEYTFREDDPFEQFSTMTAHTPWVLKNSSAV